MATYTFKGTKVTGTGDGNFLTPGAKVNDTYLNTQTGHVYKCTEVHSDWQAKGWCKWSYQRTDIIAKPNQSVFGVSAPTRDANSRVMRTHWITYDWQKNTQNGKRMTAINRSWQVNTQVIGGSSLQLKVASDISASATESQLNLNSFTIGGKTYTRADFYPLTKRIVWSTSCTLTTKNEKGLGPSITVSRDFETPRKPVISAPAFNSENGHLTFTITTDSGDDYLERYDTRYSMTVINSRTGTNSTSYGDNTSTEFTVTHDASDYMQMSYGDYIKVTVEAWARGYRGDSDHASRTYYISYPAQASILSTDISSEDSTGKCTVRVKTNSNNEHPVDGVKLEYLPNVEYSSANQIPGDAVWSDTGIVDDAECTALSVAVTELIPEKGKYTWLRVKTWHAADGRLYRYSAYKDVMHKEAPTAENDDIAILSVAPQGGQSLAVQLAWDNDNTDDSTGTELSWSDEIDTWKSTKDPEKYTFTWSDGVIYNLTNDTSVVSGKKYYTRSGAGTSASPYVYTEVQSPSSSSLRTYYEKWYGSAKIIIKGLKEGERYYVKARRYLEGDVTTYSDYSDYATCVTSEVPESIVATCDKYVSDDSSLPVYWTFSGNGIQTNWQIELSVANEDEKVILDEGEGSSGFTQIDADRLKAHAVSNSLTFRVGASTGSGFVWSEWKTVTIVSAPTLEIDVDSTLDEQPFSFTATVSEASRLLVVVSSEGTSGQFPQGVMTQTKGDTIYSAILEPQWATSQGGLTATIELPGELDFWNYGNYKISVTAIDIVTGLSSEIVESVFSVDWEHEAADPFGRVTLTPIDQTDDTGNHRKAVQIVLTAPQAAETGDVYDIYRLSGDGAQLIGKGFPLACTTVDEYAPYGKDLTLYYRIAIRTPDGDVAYSDFEYVSEGDYLRFDWDGHYLESPYSVEIQDSYSKSVEIRQHMDGSSSGYWNSNVQKKGSLSTDVIRIVQPTEADLARNLGRYAGSVFVRTPNGDAYEADVQVTELSMKNEAVYSVAFDATEVGLTQEFMLPIPFEMEEEDEEE